MYRVLALAFGLRQHSGVVHSKEVEIRRTLLATKRRQRTCLQRQRDSSESVELCSFALADFQTWFLELKIESHPAARLLAMSGPTTANLGQTVGICNRSQLQVYSHLTQLNLGL